VFQRFREARLKLNPEKCHLFQKEVRYLGHIVSPEGIITEPDKLKAVQESFTTERRFITYSLDSFHKSYSSILYQPEVDV
jgi:hypothetical protein